MKSALARRQPLLVFGERNTATRAATQMLRACPELSMRLAPPAHGRRDAEIALAIHRHMTGPWRRLYLHALRDDAEDTSVQWKHAAPRLTDVYRKARVATIFMLRNPYSWLIALARRPYHLKGPRVTTIEAFLDRPWLTERREGVASVLRSPMCLWSLKLAAYHRYAAAAAEAGLTVHFVRFEDFVADPVAALAPAVAAAGADPARLRPLATNTKDSGPDPETLRRHYAAEAWRARLTRAAVAAINAETDWTLAACHGYRRLDPADFPRSLPGPVQAEIRAELLELSCDARTSPPVAMPRLRSITGG